MSTNSLTPPFHIEDEELDNSDDFYQRMEHYLKNGDVPFVSEPMTCSSSKEEEKLDCLEQLMLVLESKIMRKFTDLENRLNSFSLRQLKRKRTITNRCRALNRRGETCNGYVCKNKSKHLCYAHYVLVDKERNNASYLYSKK
jgi:hypothetical protein